MAYHNNEMSENIKKSIGIVGGGIVGLATAFRILSKDPQVHVILFEKEARVALHQSSHNSGVLHSGIYYKPGSLKAKNCAEGYKLMVEFCRENEIAFDVCGKIIVATKVEELAKLEEIFHRGQANGLANLQMLSSEQIREREPHVKGLKGILVPQAGIVGYLDVAEKIQEKIKLAGGQILTSTEVLGIEERSESLIIKTTRGDFEVSQLINCGGLQSDRVAHMQNLAQDVSIIPFKGEYFMIREERKYLVKDLVYPVPDPNFPFLGVHFTRTIDGHLEAGPNAVLALHREVYKKWAFSTQDTLDTITWPGFYTIVRKYWKTGLGELHRSLSKKVFTEALQQLVPEIKEDDLVPAAPGIRAQACARNGSLLDDFCIVRKARQVHVLNAPSPAATSSLAIGQTIANMLE